MLLQRFLKAVQQQTIEFFWLCNKYLAVLSTQYNTTTIDFIQFSAFLPMDSMVGEFLVIPLGFKESINRFLCGFMLKFQVTAPKAHDRRVCQAGKQRKNGMPVMF